MPIRVLPEEVVVKIAAGEVVERPASVVKELIENALDAGARHIRVAIRGDGRQRIELTDDGTGIPANEVLTAFTRHATSKLSTADDLFNLHTLGFRGEALASIASVSKTTLVTRALDETVGTRLEMQAGQVLSRQSVGVPSGTQIAVEQLFFNTPARLKFLKSETAERRQIAVLVARYAMAYPAIRFVLEQDGREIFRTSGGGDLLSVLVSAYGVENARSLIEVNGVDRGIEVYGYTSTPDFSRADRSRITLFVNGRWVQDQALTYAVVQAYHTMLMTGRYPISVLLLRVPPDMVDVNVHPTKAEVRFREPDALFAGVQRAVRSALQQVSGLPTVRRMEALEGDGWRSSGLPAQSSLAVDFEAGQFARHRHFEPGGGPDLSTPAISATEASDDVPMPPRTLPVMRIVGQVGASYIIAEGPAGLYLIDQHAAHERVLYESMMAAYQRSAVASQDVLDGVMVQVAPDQALLLTQNRAVLDAAGMRLEPFGPATFLIRGVPAVMAHLDPTEAVQQVLSDLEQGSRPGQRVAEDAIILHVCKRAAVKAGQLLSLAQMQSIVQQLERCASPLTCPHGRPTMIHMSGDQLAREFGRLGSSH